MKLRDYQQKSIDKIRESFRQGSNSVCFQLPTGGGKTILAAFMIKNAVEKGNKVLFLVHLKELIEQTSEKLNTLEIDHAFIKAGKGLEESDVQVAMVQTITRRLNKMFFKPDLIIIDECHHATANSYKKILEHWPDAKVVGLSATPARLSGQGLGNIFDSMVKGPTPSELTVEGFLSPYKLLGPPNNINLNEVHTLGGEYKLDELEEAVDNSGVVGDAVIHYKKYLDGKKAIAFCVSIKHSKKVEQQFLKAGIKAKHIDSKCSKEERDEIIKAFRRGDITVLCNCSLISEGFDVPDCDGVILLRPTQSLTVFLQQVGRALRPQENKTAIILDHVSNFKHHGLPDQERDWSLESKKVLKKKKQIDDENLNITVCQECFIVFDSLKKSCPHCGTAKPVKQKKEIGFSDGELKVITQEDLEKVKKYSKYEVLMMKKDCESLEDFNNLAKKLGYKKGWAWHQWEWKSQKYKKG